MVFATDFDPTNFDPQEQSKRQTPDLSEIKPAQRNGQQRQQVNIADISPAKQTRHLIAQATQAHAQLKAQAQVQNGISAPKAVPGNGRHSETEAAIAAFQQDANYAEKLDNVLSLHPDSVASRKDGNPITRKPTLPLWLSLLNRVQQGSTVVTGLLMTGALVLYGSTVYVDRSTNTALMQLDSLQGESQELTAANEAIKQSLAEQATQEDSGLELYEAGDVLFVEPAPARELNPLPEAESEEKLVPLGY